MKWQILQKEKSLSLSGSCTRKGNISVDPAFRSAMIDKAAKLESELQQYINGLLLGY